MCVFVLHCREWDILTMRLHLSQNLTADFSYLHLPEGAGWSSEQAALSTGVPDLQREQDDFKVTSNPNHSMILFYESMIPLAQPQK